MVRIAAWPTAAEAYRIFFRNIGEFLHLAGGWMTCLLVAVVVKMAPWSGMMSFLFVLATLLCVAAAAASFFVGWCRLILQDEFSSGVITLTFGRRELRALGHLAVIALLAGVPLALLWLLVSAESWWTPLFSAVARGSFDLLGLLRLAFSLVALLAMLAASLVASARLLIALPAVALDEPGHLFGLVWQHSRNSVWPLLFGWLICILPAMVPWGALSFHLLRRLGAWVAAPAVEFLAYPFGFIALALSAGYFSYVYAQLAEAPPTPETAPQGAVAAQ